MDFHLHLFGPLERPGDALAIDLNPDITMMRWASARPGGYTTLEVGLDPDGSLSQMWLPRSIAAQPFQHVEIYAGRDLCWYGQIIVPNRGPGGEIVAFSAQGYGISATSDDFYTGTDTTTETTGGALLETILGLCAPNIQIAQFVDNGTQHFANDFYEMYPSDVINQLLREGGGAGNYPWDWLVFAGAFGGAMTLPAASFVPRIPPAQADYWLPWAAVTDWKEDASALYSAIAVDYTTPKAGSDPGTRKLSATTTTEDVVNQYGRVRRKLVKGSTMTDSVAAQYQETARLRASVPDVQASLTLSGDDLLNAGGLAMPLYLARCDQWVQIGDWPVPLPIIQTQYDAFTDSLQLTLNSYPSGLLTTLLETQAVAASTVRNTNPVTGAARTTT